MTDIGEITEALLPGTTTVLCGPKAVSKTFFLLQCFTFWMLHGVKCAVLLLEESTEHCLWRCLAQLAGLPKLTKSSWVQSHPDLSRKAWNEHRETLDLLGAQLYDRQRRNDIARNQRMVRERGREGCRIVVVDSITAANRSTIREKRYHVHNEIKPSRDGTRIQRAAGDAPDQGRQRPSPRWTAWPVDRMGAIGPNRVVARRSRPQDFEVMLRRTE
jgi:hypothetical protein